MHAAIWGGVRLADILKMQGIPYRTLETDTGGRFVEFISVDYMKVHKMKYLQDSWKMLQKCCEPICDFQKKLGWLGSFDNRMFFHIFPISQESPDEPFKSSIPLIHATTPRADILIAYEMNYEVSLDSNAFP